MYKPKAQANQTERKNTGVASNGVAYKYPVPEAGNQSARISLIVDIGTQEREDYEDPKTKELKPQKPVQQVVIFADLVDQVVDYGGDIGKKQYRLMLNNLYDNEIVGVNFSAVPPRDADGNLVQGKAWTFHPNSLLTKLAKATGNEQILGSDPDNNMNIAALLGAALYVDVQVKSTEDKNGKKDKDGNVIVYNNVKFGGASKLPVVKGKPVEVEDLEQTPLILNHDNVTKDNVVFIRGKVLEMMKKAPEYAGSALQKLIEGEGKATQQEGAKQAPKQAEEAPEEDIPEFDEPVDYPDDGNPF